MTVYSVHPVTTTARKNNTAAFGRLTGWRSDNRTQSRGAAVLCRRMLRDAIQKLNV